MASPDLSGEISSTWPASARPRTRREGGSAWTRSRPHGRESVRTQYFSGDYGPGEPSGSRRPPTRKDRGRACWIGSHLSTAFGNARLRADPISEGRGGEPDPILCGPMDGRDPIPNGPALCQMALYPPGTHRGGGLGPWADGIDDRGQPPPSRRSAQSGVRTVADDAPLHPLPERSGDDGLAEVGCTPGGGELAEQSTPLKGAGEEGCEVTVGPRPIGNHPRRRGSYADSGAWPAHRHGPPDCHTRSNGRRGSAHRGSAPGPAPEPLFHTRRVPERGASDPAPYVNGPRTPAARGPTLVRRPHIPLF